MTKHTFQAALVGAVLAVGSAVTFPAIASASTTPRTFTQNQQQLEQQLARRVSQLSRLSADVSGSTTLTSSHSGILSARLATETTNIEALVTKVPKDTTTAELNADRAAMLQDNRVFAVETPQVIEVIEADAIAAQVTGFQANEPLLVSSIGTLTGAAKTNAENHYNSFLAMLSRASSDSENVDTTVIAQLPENFPGDIHVFVSAAHAVQNADVDLADVTYDESIVALAAGGYTGS